MSQSVLYHAFGVKGVTYRSTNYVGNAIIFNVETTNRYIPCCKCGQRNCIFKDQKMRFFRLPHIGRKQAQLRVNVHRLQCKACGHKWWPHLQFAAGKQRYTHSFANTVLDMLRFATIQAIADFFSCVVESDQGHT